MTLPNVDAAIIAESKIVEYLLNPLHPDGATKAKFFLGLGFTEENWTNFVDKLRDLAANSPIAIRVESKHGTKYIVDGPISAPDGRSPFIRTVWIVDAGTTVPRFVTAYPTDFGGHR